jgi:FAD/FMN-containing dehydrogenase
LIGALSSIVGAQHVVTDPDVIASHCVDWTGRFRGGTTAVIRPANTAEVAAVVRCCIDHHVAIVAQGGNTGLVGGGVPLHGEVVVHLGRMNRVLAVDPVAASVQAQAGATIAAVHAAARQIGMRYAVDFGARDSATIGGSVATNAGGINFVRFGGTRDQLLGIEAVLGNGEVIRDVRALGKDNTGYWLPGLFCGSEGTLGIITEVVMRLRPLPEETVTALVGFGSTSTAVAAAQRWVAQLPEIEAVEYVTGAGVRLVCDVTGAAMPDGGAAAYVLVEAAGERGVVDRLGSVVGGDDGTLAVAVADGDAARTRLWRLREEHTAAINTLGPPHKLDVTVPQTVLAEFIDSVESVVHALRPTAAVWLFGHLGDGNIHVNITGLDAEDDAADHAVLRFVSELGGSISAEHGIGTAKVAALSLRRSPAELAAMRSIKQALDPHGVLNPHALLASADP